MELLLTDGRYILCRAVKFNSYSTSSLFRRLGRLKDPSPNTLSIESDFVSSSVFTTHANLGVFSHLSVHLLYMI
ncbi:MAG: hypothetical protein QXJ64_08435 [Thermosphaera sp.]